MRVITINLRDEQYKILLKAQEINKIVSRSEFFRRLMDHYTNEMVKLYERFELIPK